jgi:ceramide glucosyltransferase
MFFMTPNFVLSFAAFGPVHLSLAIIFGGLVAGSLVYCVLAIRAGQAYLRARTDPSPAMPFITVMKPLAGAEEGLRENLRSFFEQDYPEYEVLLAVASPDDPAALIAREVMAEHPKTHSRLIISGEASTPNRKVHSLRAMFAVARYDILLMADSDVRTGPDLLRVVSAEMDSPGVALVTCPYRASAGTSIWTAMEAIGLNTEFLAQILVARMLGGMDFALGPVLAIRREALDAIGGFAELQNYLAEDFVMGNRVARLGGKVTLSSFIIEHRMGAQPFAVNMGHRLRWARSTRRSRPWGYLGQVFTNPIPLALLLVAVIPRAWPTLIAVLILRFWVAWFTSQRVLRDPLTRDYWYLVPFQDLGSFLVWIGGFAGSKIVWRGKRLTVLRDGRFSA